jgi:GntR family galactonate operon transcriptional repressor
MSSFNLYQSSGTHGTVVQTLGVAIVSGIHRPGEALPTEEQLSADFGVGRSAVREGIRVLTGKGLVKAMTRRGTIVQDPSRWHLLDPDVLGWKYQATTTPADVDDLTGLRLVLEPAAARMAALSQAESVMDPIEEAFERMKASTDDTEAFIAADLDFHAGIVAATNNQLLIHLNAMMAVALAAHRHVHTTSKSRHKRTLPDHRKVMEAIREHEPDAAEAQLREIVERAHQDVLFYTGRSRRSGASWEPTPEQ